MKITNLSLVTALSLEIKEIEQRLEEIRNFAQNLVGKDETQNSFELSTVLKRQEKEEETSVQNIYLPEIGKHLSDFVPHFTYNSFQKQETNTERIGFQLSNSESLVILDFFVKRLEFERKSKLEKLQNLGVQI